MGIAVLSICVFSPHLIATPAIAVKRRLVG